MQSLALKYRPRRFEDLVGQRAVQVPLRRTVEKGRVPNALLFDGQHGTGKTTTARIFAAALNCDTPPGPCGHCVSCKSVFDGTSMDVIEIDAASNGLVEDIRKLREQVLYDVGGNYRVVLLDEAHSCSTAAFNAMLKVFEEPPPNTVFVLLTTEPGRIPDTVTSRCVPYTFLRIGVADIVTRLAHIAAAEGVTVEPALLTTIAERANGALRDAIMLLDQLQSADITTLDGYRDLTGDTDYGPGLVHALVHNDLAHAYSLVEEHLYRTGDARAIADRLAETLRDVLVLRSGGALHTDGGPLHARQALAGQLDTATTVKAMTVLWDLKTKLRPSDDPRIALDLAIALLGDVLGKPVAAPSSPVPPAGKLTLAQMRQMAE